MQINVKEFLEEAGINEPLYPGKRYVHALQQPGEYKSHCLVLDWRDPDQLRIEVKAGLSGRSLDVKKLKYYPVCFQTPTYVDVNFVNDNDDDDKKDEEEEGKSASGKGGSGGKKPKAKKLSEVTMRASDAFGSVMEGKVPELGKIIDMVVMGTQIAAEAYGNVMGALAKQIEHAKIQTTELLAQAGKFITKYTPPAFMKPTGNEDAVYKYDRAKNENIGYRSPGLG